MQYRQGDVLIEAIKTIPDSAKPERPKGQRVVLAEGELTGHAHTLPASSVMALAVPEGDLFIRVRRASLLMHQEHGKIEIPAGEYRVTRQREYSPEEIRRVTD